MFNAQTVIGDAASSMGEIAAVQDDVAQSARNVADAQVRVAADTAAANGQTISAASAGDVWRSSLLNQAATASGPLRGAILAYVASVNGIPDSTLTDIQAAIDRGDIAEANRLLNDASKTRKAEVRATTSGVAEANNSLNNAARNRTSTITVRTIGGGSETTFTTNGISRRHSGGRVAADTPYIVGRTGAEELYVPDRPGMIVDSSDTRRMLEQGGTQQAPVVNVVVELDGQVIDSRARVVVKGMLKEHVARERARTRFGDPVRHPC